MGGEPLCAAHPHECHPDRRSALGYFYFTGVETFGLVFVSGRYAVSHAAATLLLGVLGLGALVGVLAGGQLADRLLARAQVNARIMVGGGSYVLAAALFLSALLGRTLVFAMPFYIRRRRLRGAQSAGRRGSA